MNCKINRQKVRRQERDVEREKGREKVWERKIERERERACQANPSAPASPASSPYRGKLAGKAKLVVSVYRIDSLHHMLTNYARVAKNPKQRSGLDRALFLVPLHASGSYGIH